MDDELFPVVWTGGGSWLDQAPDQGVYGNQAMYGNHAMYGVTFRRARWTRES